MEMKGRKGAGVKNLAKSALIVGLCTLLALALRELGARPENCLMVYLTGVIILTIETQGYLLSLAASLLSVALFNFLFTEPLYTLRVSDPNQLLTMGVFLVIALLTSMLVTRLQAQIVLADRLVRRTQALFEISSGYLNLSGLENILYYGVRSMYGLRGEPCVVYVAEGPGALSRPYYVAAQYEDTGVIGADTLAKWCYVNNTPCGVGTAFYSEDAWSYLPIKGTGRVLGVMGILCQNKGIEEDQRVHIGTILSQMGLALERELGAESEPGNRA